ncbi:peptidylprolyl isomerase [Helicobacter anatolicus]|uniref:peptidylprolyl isomerase n=1 Tax=Helicobacter anatolicus TaxID=2905874 RepID=UPI001E4FAC67|nr:peptidylprolyl isomerase [Helicobacter anatolicus]MCE3040381.1 peptidylprolyl isomerase [Helicobacter anatolicus]
MFTLTPLKTFQITKEKIQNLQYATIQTNKGDITIKLFPEVAPQHVMNFASLANQGFYKGLIFHRVIPGFVAQGGCPNGDGRGGPGYRIACETENNPYKHLKGTLSMAHAGKDTGGSQFFICFDALPHLDGVHTIFGAIEKNDQKSFEVLDSLVQDDIIENIIISDKK